jgi:hypothetical protein
MAWIPGALGVGSLVAGAFDRSRGPDIGGIVNKWMNYRPQGYLTDEDYAQQEREKGQRAAGIGSWAGQARANAIMRAARGGYSTSPAASAAIGNVEQGAGAQLGNSALQSANELYRTKMGRERFQQELGMQGFGAELGGARAQWARGQAQKGAFWNSVNQYMPFMMDYFGKGSGGAALSSGQGAPSYAAQTGNYGGDQGFP